MNAFAKCAVLDSELVLLRAALLAEGCGEQPACSVDLLGIRRYIKVHKARLSFNEITARLQGR